MIISKKTSGVKTAYCFNINDLQLYVAYLFGGHYKESIRVVLNNEDPQENIISYEEYSKNEILSIQEIYRIFIKCSFYPKRTVFSLRDLK